MGPGSFTVMLSTLLTGRSLAAAAADVSELAAPEWWEARGWPLPPLPPPCEWGGGDEAWRLVFV